METMKIDKIKGNVEFLHINHVDNDSKTMKVFCTEIRNMKFTFTETLLWNLHIIDCLNGQLICCPIRTYCHSREVQLCQFDSLNGSCAWAFIPVTEKIMKKLIGILIFKNNFPKLLYYCIKSIFRPCSVQF